MSAGKCIVCGRTPEVIVFRLQSTPIKRELFCLEHAIEEGLRLKERCRATGGREGHFHTAFIGSPLAESEDDEVRLHFWSGPIGG